PPQQGTNPDGTPMWWIGDGDREELYVCPFTGYVYLTSRVTSGPYGPLDPIDTGVVPRRDTYLLFMSRDNGQAWDLISEDLPAVEPLIMTSTPDGRLFLFQIVGWQPTVYFTETPVGPVGTPA